MAESAQTAGIAGVGATGDDPPRRLCYMYVWPNNQEFSKLGKL